MTNSNAKPSTTKLDETPTDELSQLTPFNSDDLKSGAFARGNMLGGANPFDSASSAPWTDKP